MKKLLNLLAIIFSVQTLATNKEILSNQDILERIEKNLETIESKTELKNILDTKMVETKVKENINNINELIRINKELEMAIGKQTGTICIT